METLLGSAETGPPVAPAALPEPTGRVWIVCELYYPEDTSTGHYVTLIAEALASHKRVSVICARPNYDRRGVAAPRREDHHGVAIYRCRATRFDKNYWPLRAVNAASVSISFFLAAAARLRRGDSVLVVTNPPTLPFLTALASRLRGARCMLRIDDLYPDVMVTAGLMRRGSIFFRVLDAMSRRLYTEMAAIVVVGRDLAERVAAKMPVEKRACIQVIPNWGDVEEIRPVPAAGRSLRAQLGLQDRFIVGVAGNLGPLQGIDFLAECAAVMLDDARIHFLFIGSGGVAGWLRDVVRERGLSNLTCLGPRPRSEQNEFLNAFDLAVVSLRQGMSGMGVPSRSYNMMAAGKPILAAVEADSEIARMVREEKIGWVVAPGDKAGFVAAVRAAAADRGALAEIGARARLAVEARYSAPALIAKYETLFAR